MITLLSYVPGMSGDFVSYQIHKNENYVNLDSIQIHGVHNRYLFPCLTRDILGWEVKLVPHLIGDEIIDKLNSHYDYKDMMLPTHIFPPMYNPKLGHLRLTTENINIIKLSYAMWMFKSNSVCECPWKDRYREIMSIPGEVGQEIIKKYHKWKFLSYKHLNDTSMDVRYFVKNYFNHYYTNTQKRRAGYIKIDLDRLVYKQQTHVLTDVLDVDINKKALSDYADKNFKLLEDYNIDLYSDKFFDQLTDALEPELSKTMDLTNMEHKPDDDWLIGLVNVN